CSAPPCPTSSLTAHLVSGRITFAARGGSVETHDLATIDQMAMSASDEGTLGLVSTFVTGGMISKYPAVSCRTDQGGISVQLDPVSDPRTLTLGTHKLTPEQAGLIVAATPACDLAVTLGTTTIEVTRADGTAAPYPAVVTGDYARDFTVHLESP